MAPIFERSRIMYRLRLTDRAFRLGHPYTLFRHLFNFCFLRLCNRLRGHHKIDLITVIHVEVGVLVTIIRVDHRRISQDPILDLSTDLVQ